MDADGTMRANVLTEEHRTYNPVERERLMREHPCEDEDIMFFDERLCGILQVRRCLVQSISGCGILQVWFMLAVCGTLVSFSHTTYDSISSIQNSLIRKLSRGDRPSPPRPLNIFVIAPCFRASLIKRPSFFILSL